MSAVSQQLLLAAGGLREVSILGAHASSSFSSWATAAPGGTEPGDVAVFISVAGAGAIEGGVPVGFTVIQSETTMFVCYRICDGSESGDVEGLMAPSDDEGCGLVVFRGNAPISFITSAIWTLEKTSGNPSPQNVAAAARMAPLAVIAHTWAAFASQTFTTESPEFDLISGGTASKLGISVHNDDPQDHTIDVGDQGINSLISGWIEFH